MKVEDLRFRARGKGLGYTVLSLGFKLKVSSLKIRCSVFRVEDSGFKVEASNQRLPRSLPPPLSRSHPPLLGRLLEHLRWGLKFEV